MLIDMDDGRPTEGEDIPSAIWSLALRREG